MQRLKTKLFTHFDRNWRDHVKDHLKFIILKHLGLYLRSATHDLPLPFFFDDPKAKSSNRYSAFDPLSAPSNAESFACHVFAPPSF